MLLALPFRRPGLFLGSSGKPRDDKGAGDSGGHLEAAAEAGDPVTVTMLPGLSLCFPHQPFLLNAHPPGVFRSPKAAAASIHQRAATPGRNRLRLAILINVVSFSHNVVLRNLLFSLNLVPEPRILSV
jgi:hypothetical protein